MPTKKYKFCSRRNDLAVKLLNDIRYSHNQLFFWGGAQYPPLFPPNPMSSCTSSPRFGWNIHQTGASTLDLGIRRHVGQLVAPLLITIIIIEVHFNIYKSATKWFHYVEYMPLLPASQLKASEELNEPSNPDEVIAQAHGLVLELIGAEEQQHFEWALLAMLRQAKWDIHQAAKKIYVLLAYAGRHPKLFQDASAGEFIRQAGVKMMSHLPARNSWGELVILVDGEKFSPYAREYTLTDMLRFSVFYMSVIMHDKETQAAQVSGVVIVENLENYPLTALSRMSGTSLSGIKACFD
jgi:hypothetical protein